MRRFAAAILAAVLLCGCAADPLETTLPTESTTTPVETAIPVETTVPVETTLPAETTAPVETTLPPETESADPSYTIKITDPETLIYSGPAFRQGAAAMVGESGTYTIVEEATDSDGNLWGRLKSGAGWLCLTDPPLAPIHADYAQESFNAYHAYWSEETDYITSIGFTPTETLTDVRFGLLEWFETDNYVMQEVLYTIDEMDPDRAFLAQVVFWGDLTTYGISFTDERGESRHYALMISGKDGSLLCAEYTP